MYIDSLRFTTGHSLLLGQAPGYSSLLSVKQQKRQLPHLIASDLLDVKESGASTVVVLLPRDNLKERYFSQIDLLRLYREIGLNVIHFPIEDYAVPKSHAEFDKLITTIGRKLKTEDVLVHCAAGLGRTGTVATGLLIKLGASTSAALRAVRSKRPGAVETAEQVIFLREYEDMYGKNSRKH